MQNLNSSDGWGKNLANLPSLTLDKIVAYVERVDKTFITKLRKIEKDFQRGQQLLEENFIDLNSILSKQNDKYFSVKGICSASLKQKDRWVFIVIQKSTGDIEFATCQCPAGRAGTCSHSYAVSKVIAKWVIDRVTIIPQQRACTSKPCVWSVPQSRGRLEKHSINDLEIKSPPSKKSKVSESNSTKQGINSTLYVADAHSRPDNENSNISKLLDPLKGSNPSLHFLETVNTSCRKKCETKFGFKPEGSVLGVQMSLLPSSFKVYTSNIAANDISYVNKMPATYPKYLFTNTEMKLKT